jgi:hypothetical protein
MQETSQVVKLWNDGDLTVMVDSISIVGLDASYFSILSSSPPGRIDQPFALDPGNENAAIDYLIAFDPKGTTEPHAANLVVHTSQGNPMKVKLIGIVPASNVASVDTTFVGPAAGLGLALSADHTFKLKIINEGEAPFQITNALWSGDLDVTLDSLTTKATIPAGSTKEISVVMRSAEAGTKSKLFKFNGNECDEPFEMKITAYFGEQSSVALETSDKVEVSKIGNSIHVKHSASNPLTYRVVDLNGRVVISGSVGQSDVIDISTLTPGAYIFDLGNKRSLKFLKG